MSKSILKKKRISIREYQPEDRERVINLLNAPSIKPDIWEWQFDKRYFSSTIKPIVAEDNWGNILGFNGMMPVKLHTKEFGELEAAWSCDFFVSRHCRGLGVGKEIKRELKKQSPITFALGTSPAAAAVLEKSGWLPYRQVFNYSTNGASAAKTHAKIQLTDATELPPLEMINALWEEQKDRLSAAIPRDGSYLNWRYALSPIAEYQYLYCQTGNKLQWIAVYHLSPERVSLVDYLGPNDQTPQRDIVATLINKHSNFRCMTSCPAWKNTFAELGIKKSDKPVNCFIYSEDAQIANTLSKNFYVMPGDCDGDILGSSVTQARMKDLEETREYTCEQIPLERFLTMKDEWDALVYDSDNPNLFSSWAWVTLWWKHFTALNNFRLELILCKHKGKLVGIAPMYVRTYRQFCIPVKQMQIIGCSWSGPNTFRSEYLDFIVHREHARHARLALLDHIHEKIDWNELVLGDIRHESQTTRLLEECYGKYKLYPRTVHEDHSVIVNTNTSRQDYTQNLSANFRRSALNSYNKLQQKYDCHYASYTDTASLKTKPIDTLNTLHTPRWGKPCFEGEHKAFHQDIIKQFSANNNVNISLLNIDKNVHAITYNLRYHDTLYNIQLGHKELGGENYALGFIQLMQNILQSIEHPEIKNFDLLAGYGKQEYYKERFGGKIQNIATKQYLKGFWVKLIYKVYDKQRTIRANRYR